MKLSKRFPSTIHLMLFAAIALVACGNKGAQSIESDKVEKSVIVIGAGIAGLSAARLLDDHGFDVTVLESRERIGGRLWSDRSIDGVALDLGASWIHGISSNPIYDLAQKHQLPLFEWDYEDAVIYDKDGHSSAALFSRIESLNNKLTSLFSQNRFRNSSLDDVIQTGIKEGELSDYNQTEINYVASAFYENEFAAPSKKLSVASLMEGEIMQGPEVIFPEGFDQVSSALARGLKILTNHTVSEIDYRSQKPIVLANQQRFEADYVLVTVPLGVLKSNLIKFRPELPTDKQEAIDALDMGTLNKVYLKFSTAFWNDEAQNLGYISEPRGQFTYWINLLKATEQPILLGFMSGVEAEAMENMSDQDVIASAMKVLRTIYGNDIPEPEQHIITRWTNDPHTYGSYSYLTTQGNNEMRDDLGEPIEGRVFFAGEATHPDYPSTVHGAFLSGKREAMRMINSLP